MLKKIIQTIMLLELAYGVPTAAWAQDEWQLSSSLMTTTGHYSDSITLKNQQSLGIRMSGEKDQAWGFSAGLQTTNMRMQPIAPAPRQNQDDWLVSGFLHLPSKVMPGRLTLQLDAYKTTNNAFQSNSSDVQALAPQVIWQSYALPLKIDIGYARSKYKNTDGIDQTNVGLGLGFNESKNWLQFRGYAIQNLTPVSALGQTRNTSTDIKLTHLFGGESSWMPSAVTLGIERGKKIYFIDVATQTVHNLPMINEGGENVSASWKIFPKTNLNIHWSRNQYRADQPWVHRFKLSTLSAQVTKNW